ncbi:uncharacterized protein At5g39570-like [Ananas comosus]|uniref:Uncharacterized protein At5g39570-like n=1 Tax=Ananas comosus TaxID=4615 RepID=A0A6P5GTY2_ANACO|nr:uncharacterized protein At5g39570-like [Ananas comosus]
MAWRGGGGGDLSVDDVNDYVEYDPTPYGGGYDISLTFGQPLPPSDDICYPISSSQSTSSSSAADSNRAQYSSDSAASSYYADSTDSGDRRYGRPRPKPQCAYNSGGDGGGYGMSEEYGHGERPSSYERPSYEEESGTHAKPSYYVQGQGEVYNYNRPKYIWR